MTTASVDRPPLAVVDTNVLLAATDRSRERHEAATAFLRDDPRRLAVSPQIIREYLAVMTRPAENNGLGMGAADAIANAEAVLAVTTLLSEGPRTTTRLLELLLDGSAPGKQVHDANIVACAIIHDAEAIVTMNRRHFARFAALVTVEDLTS